MRCEWRPTLAVFGMLAAVAPLRAQDQKKPIELTGDVGLVNTSGNTHLSTLNLGDKLIVRSGLLLLTQTFALVYGKSEGIQSANSRQLRARADYTVAARLAAYGFAGYERNRFAGIDHRTDQGVGMALAAWRDDHNELDLEAGAGLVQESLFPDPELDATVSHRFVSGRGALRYRHRFTKTAYVQQSLEYLPNVEHGRDFRINSESALIAPISRHFGLKAGYLIQYNHLPPSADLARTDRMLTTGLQVTF